MLVLESLRCLPLGLVARVASCRRSHYMLFSLSVETFRDSFSLAQYSCPDRGQKHTITPQRDQNAPVRVRANA
jgi:hypothetical protein